jgi:hypothetical protein
MWFALSAAMEPTTPISIEAACSVIGTEVRGRLRRAGAPLVEGGAHADLPFCDCGRSG